MSGERAVATVSQGAVERNSRLLTELLGEGSSLCAVVKADAYGHGADSAAAAALRGGAEWLAVATAAEAEALRSSQPHTRILVMGALDRDDLRRALAVAADVGVWKPEFLAACISFAEESGAVARVHVKHDSGMGRLGVRDPDAAISLLRAAEEGGHVELAGAWTHFATADDPTDPFLAEQLDAFAPVVEAAREANPGVTIHAANSGATLSEPASHFDMVRCGIAVYGLDPFGVDPEEHGLEPALELSSYVSDLKRFPKGASAGYGRRWRAPTDTWVAVLPIGYGDGYVRAFGGQAEVLIGGRRYPVVGAVSMDNLTVDLGPETSVEAGERAVLIGRQGRERVSAEELARIRGTINYEVVTSLTSRVDRRQLD